ncbi:HNH endonuclease [Clostridium algoriphilum]|uniref:HNH endonuclease n=1 Tax=Clostridium algoriphilum TaxID=198347 RepID=UPI001CF5E030|nr:HNH endonuclease [Clostridium algoriphilum]MCB2292418.1 HNH endonuclease [Clostridium algoriphilum]
MKKYNIQDMIYTISNYGEVFGKSGLLKTRPDKDGYLVVTLGRKGKRQTKKIHRLVAELFLLNEHNLLEVNHKDFNRANPRFDNLEWSTHKDNVLHSSLQGRYSASSIGSKNSNARLTEKEVLKIRALHDNGDTVYKIAKLYVRGWQTINHVVKRTTWKHV